MSPGRLALPVARNSGDNVTPLKAEMRNVKTLEDVASEGKAREGGYDIVRFVEETTAEMDEEVG